MTLTSATFCVEIGYRNLGSNTDGILTKNPTEAEAVRFQNEFSELEIRVLHKLKKTQACMVGNMGKQRQNSD
jgi:hypothetical protein